MNLLGLPVLISGIARPEHSMFPDAVETGVGIGFRILEEHASVGERKWIGNYDPIDKVRAGQHLEMTEIIRGKQTSIGVAE